jgi:hypothetical protein
METQAWEGPAVKNVSWMDDKGWVDTYSNASRRLQKAGYAVGGYRLDNGEPRFVLYRDDTGKLERVHEFDSAEELNNMIKLLLPPEEE